jgi:hypothetical protein
MSRALPPDEPPDTSSSFPGHAKHELPLKFEKSKVPLVHVYEPKPKLTIAERPHTSTMPTEIVFVDMSYNL